MACVNKSLEGFKDLAKQFGDGLAESLVVNNGYQIPTTEEAINMIRGSKVRQFKNAVGYIQNTKSGDVDTLIQNFGKIIQKTGDKVYIVKGGKLTDVAAPLAKTEILDRNVKFLEAINKRVGKLFNIGSLQENKTATTQGFFSDVVTGKSEKFKAKKEWSPITTFSAAEEAFKKVYDTFKGNFDNHIATSIPTFRELQIKVGSVITNLFTNGGLVYDIGGSEGGFVKAISESSNGNIRSINLDVNEDMQAAHNKVPVEGSNFVPQAFLEDYTDATTGKTYPRHIPQEKADVVHESMVFQFISPERKQFIKEIADNYVKSDGIVLLEEKVLPQTEEEWKKNEAVKDQYKLQYYPQEALNAKAEQVLAGMKKNQTAETDLLNALQEHFDYVGQYWDAGNFRGYIATNSKEKFDQFFNNMQPVTSEYSARQSSDLLKIEKGKFTQGSLVEKAPLKIAGREVLVNPTAFEFRTALTKAVNNRPYDGVQVDIQNEAYYQQIMDDGGYIFLTSDSAIGGFVTADGYVGSIFKDPAVKDKVTPDFFKIAVQYGGRYLDAYSTTGTVYTKNGFVAVAKMEFNENYAPVGWQNTVLANRPEVIFYSYDPNNVNPNPAVEINDYNEGLRMASEHGVDNEINKPIDTHSDETTNISTNKEISPDSLTVDIDQNILQQIADKNKSVVEPQLFEEAQVSPEESNTTFQQARQKRSFYLSNITKMLTNKFGLQFETINDASQQWAGKYSQGKIILNEAYLTAEIPFHEVMHPFVLALKSENVVLYNSLMSELINTEEGQKILDRIKETYPELSEVEQQDEALVSVLGKMLSDRNNDSKSVIRKFLDWLQTTLAKLGVYVKEFTPNLNLQQMADLIMDPSFVYDLQDRVNFEDTAEYYYKVNDESTFDNVMDDIIRKLRADTNIPGKNEDEKTRKYFSGLQLELLQKNRKDIEGIDNFIKSALIQTKAITDKFEEFKGKYESKQNKSQEDIQQMSKLLHDIETNIVLYSDLRPLLRSMRTIFPEAVDNYGNLFNYLNRQDDLITGYKNYGLDVVAEWLLPYAQKAIKSAVATGKRNTIVTDETYNTVKRRMNSNGITDGDLILREAVKQELKNTLLIAKDDADFFTTWLSGVTNTRDSISSLLGIAVVEEMQKAFKRASQVKERITKALRQYRGNVTFSTAADEEAFYKKYLRQADSWEYAGLNNDGTEKYEYRKRWAFHEEFLMDKFYNAKREAFEKLGPAPSRENEKEFKKWKDARDKWLKDNTDQSIDTNGKLISTPKRSLYGNTEFAGLMNDPYYNLLYTTYRNSNIKLGTQGLKYGMIPQVSKGKNLFTSTARIANKLVSKNKAGALDDVRSLVGDQEQLYFAENIEGFERKTVPINYVSLLEDEDLSFNLADTVSRLATSSYKYEAMSAIEPQILVMKNFVGGNSNLKIDKRKALQSTAKGVHKLIRGTRELLPMEAKKRNEMVMSFIDDVVYGKEDDRQVIQGWGARFVVYDKNDTSNNGKPMKQIVKNFEDLRQLVGRPDLNYSDFKPGQEIQLGDHVVKLSNKDINISLNKIGNNLGLVTALQNMALNVNSMVANVGIGNIATLVESAGGKYFTMKDWGNAQKEYFKSALAGSFFQDLKGDKQSKISQLLAHYDGIMGEFQDELGKTITPGIANKLFRRDHLFVLQKSGEHQIQSVGMIAMMYGQKVKTTAGEEINLYDAWEKDSNGEYKLRSDINWTTEQDDAFRNALQGVNKELNGNFSKLDKAKLQRVWWGRILMLFRKHIYNGFKSRYGKEQVNYEQGTVTEGYYRTFMTGLSDQLSSYILNKKFKPLSEQEKYAVRKLAADLAVVAVLFTLFKATDDDDDDNEFTDLAALWSRRLLSDSAQYAPILGWMEMAKVVRDPSASVNTVEKYYKAFRQLITDPDEVYSRSGPGYTEGELKWKVQMSKLIPVYRQFINLQEPENLLKFYKLNASSLGKKKEEDDDSDSNNNR